MNLPFRPPLQSVVSAQHTLAVSSDFTWNDVVSLSPKHDSSDLRGFFRQVALCNRNSVLIKLSLTNTHAHIFRLLVIVEFHFAGEDV